MFLSVAASEPLQVALYKLNYYYYYYYYYHHALKIPCLLTNAWST